MREAFGRTFDVPDGYLNTASIGIPPADAARAVAESVARWGRGQDGPADFVLAPRGAAWLAIHPDAPPLRPNNVNWYAGEDPWDSTYGLPLRLAGDARALDLSPTWLAQVGAAVSMDWLSGLDLAAVAEHCTGLADAFRAELGLPPAGSAIVSVPVPDAVSKLTAAGIACAARAGRARLSFHLYNTASDVERAVRALR
ncbi:hypothetical protein GCM10011581_09350 [Saccharopolyspora subtropica]|uniref:Aminotransferase class V n=1 Tax=Saccharopolyspora thermophila TaxID=89367 RepID=A0A917JKK8_9PSEU|nr:hypothetical protein [Saccharopolyspora subtropica]GGI74508.1 hypothetical protein GCM10011581_09350 [Saccharopolyspora subtropica]